MAQSRPCEPERIALDRLAEELAKRCDIDRFFAEEMIG